MTQTFEKIAAGVCFAIFLILVYISYTRVLTSSKNNSSKPGKPELRSKPSDLRVYGVDTAVERPLTYVLEHDTKQSKQSKQSKPTRKYVWKDPRNVPRGTSDGVDFAIEFEAQFQGLNVVDYDTVVFACGKSPQLLWNFHTGTFTLALIVAVPTRTNPSSQATRYVTLRDAYATYSTPIHFVLVSRGRRIDAFVHGELVDSFLLDRVPLIDSTKGLAAPDVNGMTLLHCSFSLLKTNDVII